MTIDSVSGPTTALVRTALDAALMRHQMHAANIANASVAGYRPMRLDFGDAMARARADIQAGGAAAHGGIAELAPDVVPLEDGFGNRAGKVELDVEVAGIAHNTLAYQALMKGLSRYMGILGIAMSDGRR